MQSDLLLGDLGDQMFHFIQLTIEGTPHENKMAGKGQITSERASS
jgi:hypothetical protein